MRDEDGQARELEALLELIDASGADGAFVYTYIAPSYPSSADPVNDLDTASFALVRSWPDGRTEPKAAYQRSRRAMPDKPDRSPPACP